MGSSHPIPETDDDIAAVDGVMARARAAQREFEAAGSQALYDRAAAAAAWAIMEPARNRELAELAVASTGLGNVADKITKNHRKTLGLMRDLARARTHGVTRDDPALGITEIARPLGVIGAVVPSTNPAATPANNIINALKCGNAIVVSPSPKGQPTCARLLEFIHAQFDRAGLDRDLVQMIPPPGSKARTQRLLETADLAVVTGSQDNVRRAYSSGTPAIGVGAGNVPVIVDETADLAAAADKIAASKCFDNATSCSSENSVIVLEAVRDAFVKALAAAGGALIDDEAGVTAALFPGGRLNPEALARDADVLAEVLGVADRVPRDARFFVVPTRGVGPDHPLSGEKLSLVLALYTAPDFASAADLAERVLRYQGAGHSVGLHTGRDDRALALGRRLPTCRVIVNQPHTFATGGSFENAMPFSLSMGCGSWGRNSIDTNLHWRHFMQTTKIVRPIPPDEPAVEDIFADYWREVGR